MPKEEHILIIGNDRLVCPLNSYSFDVATGACDNPEIRPVQIFETAVRDGQLNVRVAPPRRSTAEG